MILTPECFGIPSVFNFRSPVCCACSQNEPCRKQAHLTLCGMKQDIGYVRSALIEHERVESCPVMPVASVVSSSGKGSGEKGKRTSKVPKRKRFDLTNAQEHILSSLPKNAQVRLSKLYRYGYDAIIRNEFRAGGCAFSEIANQRSLVVALQMLGDRKQIAHADLRIAYTDMLGWSELSAKSEVTIMWHVLPGLGVAERSDNVLVLHPGLCK